MDSTESKLGKISMRAWLALLMVSTMCLMSACEVTIEEPLYSAVLLSLGFYFGQKDKP